MHTSHCICHTVRSRSCCHVVRVKCTSCTTTWSNWEIFLSSFKTLFLICSCYRVLESCRVCRVSCDGYIYVLFPHDLNTFYYVVSSVAVNFCTKSVRISLTEYFFQLSCMIVKLCLNICKSVDTCNDLSSVFSKTVQDNTKRFLTNLICFLCDTDCTLCCCEWLVSSQECEALCILFKKHLSKVTMSKTNFSLICNRSRNTERLKSLSDCCCCVCTSLFDCDSCTYSVSPFCVLKTDWLDSLDHLVNIKTGCFRYFSSFFDGVDSILSKFCKNLFLSSFIWFK